MTAGPMRKSTPASPPPADESPLRGILDYTEDPIVSSDVVKST